MEEPCIADIPGNVYGDELEESIGMDVTLAMSEDEADCDPTLLYAVTHGADNANDEHDTENEDRIAESSDEDGWYVAILEPFAVNDH